MNETAEVRCVRLDEAQAMIASGDILGAITVIAVQHAPAATGLFGREFPYSGTRVIVAGLAGPPCLDRFQARRRV